MQEKKKKPDVDSKHSGLDEEENAIKIQIKIKNNKN